MLEARAVWSMLSRLTALGLWLGGCALLAAPAQAAGGTLQQVRERGYLLCGTSQGVAGFSRPDQAGKWVGFDTDVCRALAAAIFDDPEKARYVSLSSKDRLVALQSGEVDVLSRTTTWTMSRDAGQGLNFTAVNFYDGQGFLVRKSVGAKNGKDLIGASICVTQGTTNELNLADYFRVLGGKYEAVAFQNIEQVAAAYESGRCDAYSTDLSQLASIRLGLAKPDDHVLLPDVISKEPIGPWVRHGDDQWFDIVRWAIFALIDAEELGVTQANVEQMKGSQNPDIRRLLGVEGKFGEALGLSSDWAARMIKVVGNYGESYDRHLGAGSPIGLPRGRNELWTRGGLQYAPPIR